MAPSDMSLHITTKVGYNNKIVIATSTQVLGVNDDINTDPVPPLVDASPRAGEKEVHPQTNNKISPAGKDRGNTIKSTKISPQATTKPGISDQALAKTSEQAQIPPGKQSQIVRPEPEKMPADKISPAEKSHHEEEKTALIVSGIVIVTLAIWFLR